MAVASFANGKGNHEIWFGPISGIHFTADATTRYRFTANGAVKQAGIGRAF